MTHRPIPCSGVQCVKGRKRVTFLCRTVCVAVAVVVNKPIDDEIRRLLSHSTQSGTLPLDHCNLQSSRGALFFYTGCWDDPTSQVNFYRALRGSDTAIGRLCVCVCV